VQITDENGPAALQIMVVHVNVFKNVVHYVHSCETGAVQGLLAFSLTVSVSRETLCSSKPMMLQAENNANATPVMERKLPAHQVPKWPVMNAQIEISWPSKKINRPNPIRYLFEKAWIFGLRNIL
jgi:hypothetical protein